MSGWTEQGVLDREQRRRLAEGFAGALAPFVEQPKVGRIKGVSAEADRTYNGRVYHSKSEAEYAQRLDFQVKARIVHHWTPQVTIPIIVNNVPICKVVVDFKVFNVDGTVDLVEIKGFETETFRLKKKLLLACYPGICYTVIKVGARG